MSMRFKQALGESACTCSPFSGNEGSCCNGTDKCEHWGESLECGVGDLKGEKGNRLHDTGHDGYGGLRRSCQGMK